MSPALDPPATPGSLWQRFYAAVLSWRRRIYRSRAKRLERPVVSVGNLHWGGSGKTPLVAAIAARYGAAESAPERRRRRRVAVLTRGYGGRGRGVRVASRGEGPRLGADDIGDEPTLLARELPGVAVIVGKDRFEAGKHALASLDPPPDLFVLDDGFSHVRLHRDVDILAFPSAAPFGGGRLAPTGRLREPLTASRHADAVVLTDASPPLGRELAAALAPFGFNGRGFAAELVARPARLESGEELAASQRVVAVSGLARNASFHRLARRVGFEIVAALELRDHHGYPEATLREIQRLWTRHDAAAVLTTAKDHVKLEGRLDLPLAVLPISLRPEPDFWGWLDTAIERAETAIDTAQPGRGNRR